MSATEHPNHPARTMHALSRTTSGAYPTGLELSPPPSHESNALGRMATGECLGAVVRRSQMCGRCKKVARTAGEEHQPDNQHTVMCQMRKAQPRNPSSLKPYGKGWDNTSRAAWSNKLHVASIG